MRLRSVVSLTLVVGVTAVVLLAARAPGPPVDPPRHFLELDSPTALVLPEDADQLRIALTTRGEGEPPDTPIPLELTVVIEDAWGAPLGTWHLRQDSRPAVLPGTEEAWRPTAWVLGQPGWLAETRALHLDLPPGAATAVLEGEGLLGRVFARGPERDSLSRRMSVLSRAGRARVERATGVPDAGLLGRDERSRVTARSWQRLGPRDATEAVARPVITETMVGSDADVLRGTVLLPGETVAWTVVGSARLHLAGTEGTVGLEVSGVGDGEVPTVSARLALPGEHVLHSQALDVDVDAVGPVSVLVRNPHEHTVRVWLRASPSVTWFGAPPMAPMTWLVPDHPGHIVAPERRGMRLWTADSRRFVATGDVMRLEARVAAPPGGAPSRPVGVRALSADGEVRWQQTWDVPAERDVFARVVDEDGDLPVSVVTSTLVATGPGVQWIEVDGGSDVWVRGHVPGPQRGHAEGYTLPVGEARLRLGKAASTWHAWRPVDPERDAMTVRATMRLEPPGEDAGAERRFRALDLPAATLWAAQQEEPGTAPSVCRVPVDTPRTLTGRGDADLVRGWLWAPADELGEPWEVTRDGRSWRGGRLLQPVSTLRAGRQSWPMNLTLAAPAGTVLWLGGGDGVACEDTWQLALYERLPAGGTLRVAVPPGPAGRLLALPSLGEVEATVEARLDGAIDAALDATRPQTLLTLLPTGRRAAALRTPGQEAGVLRGRAVRLGSDLVAGGVLRVVSHHDEVLWVRVVLEDERGRVETSRATVLSDDEVAP